MTEFNIHSILRAQKLRPPAPTPLKIDYFFDAMLWAALAAWSIGFRYGEVLMCWLRLLYSE